MSETYPKDVNRFTAWSKAMVQGATVGKPNYGKSRMRKFKMTRRWTRSRRVRKGHNGSKD